MCATSFLRKISWSDKPCFHNIWYFGKLSSLCGTNAAKLSDTRRFGLRSRRPPAAFGASLHRAAHPPRVFRPQPQVLGISTSSSYNKQPYMNNRKFAVIGLGYFGLNLALRLVEEGAEVIAVDRDEQRVDHLRDKVSYVVCMDTTDIRALQRLGLRDMDAVIVAIGENFQGSLLTTALLQEIGVERIINRVTSPTHERLLKLMNITELLVPEAEAASQLVKRLMLKGVVGAFELSREYSIIELAAPESFVGSTVFDLNLRNRYSLNLVTIKRIERKRGLLTLGEQEVVRIIGVPAPETVIEKNDILVLFGKEKDIQRLYDQ